MAITFLIKLEEVFLMSSDSVIEVNNVSKCFNIYNTPSERLKQLLFRNIKGTHKEFWALKNISFNVYRGETVGIVGKNGSGKSTLLQIITGTLSQSTGSVKTKGRVAALLELGSGFNPDFTGRENVYMNATLLGLKKKEIDEKFNSIIEFADIGDFIDQPVKTYSSGMMVRLAFAVQAQIDPDILIVDEALAVGDAKFQARCFERLNQLKRNGTSILLVTHSTEQIVSHCSRAILINSGEIVDIDEPRVITNQYLDLLFGRSKSKETNLERKNDLYDAQLLGQIETELSCGNDIYDTRPCFNELSYRWGDGRARIIDFLLSTEAGEYPLVVASGTEITLKFAVIFHEKINRPIFGCTIKTKDGVTVYGSNSEIQDLETENINSNPGSVSNISIKFVAHLAPGDYFISLGVASHVNGDITPHDRRYDSILLSISPDKRVFGLSNLYMGISIDD